MTPPTEPDGPQPLDGEVAPEHSADLDYEEVDGELVGDPKIRRAIELSVQQNIENHLHLRERDLLPDPDELARFDKVVPGLAARVADEWQRESRHRRGMEVKMADGQLAGYRRYQIFAFVLILALLAGSVFLFAEGENALGFLFALPPAVSVVVRALLAILSGEESSDEVEKTETKRGEEADEAQQ